MRENRNKICAIGEVGLDNYYIKKQSDIQKSKDVFIRFIDFAKEFNKPIIVHSRDAFEDAIKILEQEDARKVQMHMFGANHLLKRVIDNGWFVSLNTIVLRSKKHYQITRDMPMELLMTETDAPWNAPAVFLKGEKVRNDPTSVKAVIEEISAIKRMKFEDVDKITSQNAKRFFNLG